MIFVILEYRSVSHERATLLEERREVEKELKERPAAFSVPVLSAPLLTVRF
ncbi:MAG TPA: hypothetical protein VGK67_28065 [Myxococcales bacterium]